MARSEPPHLWYRPPYYDPRTGRLRKKGVWVIVDGRKTRVTGCGLEDRADAERQLAEYLGDKHEPSRKKNQGLDEILLSDVVSIYLRDRIKDQKRPEKAAQRFVQLLDWWGDKTLDDVNGRSCRDYVAWRCSMPWKSAKPDVTGNTPRMVTAAGARRELEDLRAAIGYHHSEGYHREVVKVWLPPRSPSRTRYLRRSELAALLWRAWRKREQMKVVRGPRAGEPVLSSKRPARHIARFLLVAAYTGTRAAAIGSAGLEPSTENGWIDLKTGRYYRAAEGAVETNKRQPTVVIPRRLLMHIRRWKKANPSMKWVVEYRGKPVNEVNKGFGVLVRECGLGKEVVPHTLRHTCATWLSQRGASMTDAAAFLGMTQAIYEKTYRHHSPMLTTPGMVTPQIFFIFDPGYHPRELLFDDGWVEDDKVAA